MMLELLESPERNQDLTAAVLHVMLKAAHATISLSRDQSKIHMLELEANTYARLLDWNNIEYVCLVLRLLQSFFERLLRTPDQLQMDMIPRLQAAQLLQKIVPHAQYDGNQATTLTSLAAKCAHLLVKCTGQTEAELVSYISSEMLTQCSLMERKQSPALFTIRC